MFGIKLSQVDFTVCICECLVLNDLKYIKQCIYVNVWY